MWEKAARPFVESGELVMLGVIQEQHAERCRLYSQWKQYKFPIAQDAFTQLGLAVVPVPILIDEHGIVRHSKRVRPNTLIEFVNKPYAPTESNAPKLDAERATIDYWSKRVAAEASAENFTGLGDANLNWGGADGTGQAIAAYKSALKLDEKNAKIHFRLGVAYRARFDSVKAETGDFAAAANSWTKAVSMNPNQYIWRRRIQQYGPQQIKPYPFYDWVGTAAKEIIARGEQPIPLKVALTGAEKAKPMREFVSDDNTKENPDPDGKIARDRSALIRIESVVVPTQIKPGQSTQIHLRLIPNNGKWNNEANPVESGSTSTINSSPQSDFIQYHNQKRLNRMRHDRSSSRSTQKNRRPTANYQVLHCTLFAKTNQGNACICVRTFQFRLSSTKVFNRLSASPITWS